MKYNCFRIIYRWQYKMPLSVIFITFLFLSILTNLLITAGESMPKELSDIDPIILNIAGIIFIPFIETLMFQSFIIEVFSMIALEFFKSRLYIWTILLSAFLFGISHCYNFKYIILTTIAGLYIALFYVVARRKKGIKNAYLQTVLFHATNNITVCLLNLIST